MPPKRFYAYQSGNNSFVITRDIAGLPAGECLIHVYELRETGFLVSDGMGWKIKPHPMKIDGVLPGE